MGFLLSLNSIPEGDRAKAYGTYCMSKPHLKANADGCDHIVNKWLKNIDRKDLLNQCAGLLYRKQDGKLTLLSSPRLYHDIKCGPCITGQLGNSLCHLNIVSLPFSELRKTVIAFVPERAILGVEIISAKVNSEKMSIVNNHEVYKAFGKVPLIIPLEFGHGLHEEMDEDTMKSTLKSRHNFYADWIEMTAKLFEDNNGVSLHQFFVKEASERSIKFLKTVAHSAGVSSVSSAPNNSQAWKLLQPELERIQWENVCAWKESHSGSCVQDHPQDCTLYQPELEQVQKSDATALKAMGPAKPELEKLLNSSVTTFKGSKPANSSQDHQQDSSSLQVELEQDQLANTGVRDEAYLVTSPVQDSLSCTSPQLKSEQIEVSTIDECRETHPVTSLQRNPAPGHAQKQKDISVAVDSSTASKTSDGQLEGQSCLQPLKKRSVDSLTVATKRQKKFGQVEDKILSAMAEFHSLKIQDIQRILVALLAGYCNVMSKGFKDGLKELMKQGLVKGSVKHAGALCLTEQGVQSMSQVMPAKNTGEIHERFLKIIQLTKLNTPSNKLRDVWGKLSDGQPHRVDDLANAAGYTNIRSKGFKDMISTLTGLGLIQTTSEGHYMFKDLVFPFGRPYLSESI